MVKLLLDQEKLQATNPRQWPPTGSRDLHRQCRRLFGRTETEFSPGGSSEEHDNAFKKVSGVKRRYRALPLTGRRYRALLTGMPQKIEHGFRQSSPAPHAAIAGAVAPATSNVLQPAA